jgi:hypothetical protein
VRWVSSGHFEFMITLPGNFFSAAKRPALRCTARAGAAWIDGDIWLVRRSPYNPRRGRYVLLASAYEERREGLPDAAQLLDLLGELATDIPAREWETFCFRAALLRAIAREYFEGGL